MSLDVPTPLLDAAARGELDDGQFVALVRDSLPYAWQVIGAAAGDLAARPGVPFGEHEVPPPSERERGQLLRALAGNAIRGRWSATSAWCSPSKLPRGGGVRPDGGRLADPP